MITYSDMFSSHLPQESLKRRNMQSALSVSPLPPKAAAISNSVGKKSDFKV